MILLCEFGVQRLVCILHTLIPTFRAIFRLPIVGIVSLEKLADVAIGVGLASYKSDVQGCVGVISD